MASVTIKQICTILAGEGHEPLSEMRITQLVRDGMPKEARGQYDPVRCMYWYIGSLRTVVSRRETQNTDGTSSNLTTERKRLITAQAERTELELAKTRGELITTTECERLLSEIVLETRARLLAVPARAARQLVGEKSMVMAQAKVEKEIRVALDEMAKHAAVAPTAQAKPEAAAGRRDRPGTESAPRETPPQAEAVIHGRSRRSRQA